jgi:hypothetical protein
VLRLPLDLKKTAKQRSESVSRTLADADREHILETLEQANWLIISASKFVTSQDSSSGLQTR